MKLNQVAYHFILCGGLMPHLKGIFYMDAEDVFDYWDNVGTYIIEKKEKGIKLINRLKEKFIHLF